MKDIMEFLNDDKNLVIIAVFILGIAAVFVNITPENTGIIEQIITGLFGLAVGKTLK